MIEFLGKSYNWRTYAMYECSECNSLVKLRVDNYKHYIKKFGAYKCQECIGSIKDEYCNDINLKGDMDE